MTPDDGEDDDAPLGPPPDPSLRQWRHPSEIASANAAALRDISPGQTRRWRSWSFLGGCAIGLIGVVVLGTAVVRPFATGANDLEDAALSTTLAPSWTTTDGDLASPSTTIDGVADDDPAAEETDDPTAATATTTITPVAATPPLPPTLEAGASGVIAILDATDQSLVATGLVIDGMVITSAHALGDRTDVLLGTPDHPIDGLVAGTDPFSDLAVIATLDPDQLPAPIQLASTKRADLAAGSTVWVLAAGDQPTPTALSGEVTAADQDVMTSGGVMVFDALQTTIRTPVFGAGGAVVDQDGNTIAMVVACDRHLASALPIESLRITAQSIRETGWAHIGWLGIEGEGSSDGIRLRSVDPDGPAALAGLEAGDVLVSVAGEPLQHIAGIVRAIRLAGVGNQVDFEVRRGDDLFEATITIGTRIG